MSKTVFIVTVTDTFSGEANFSWVRTYWVYSKSERGAISLVSRWTGHGYRFRFDGLRYNARGACVCAFVDHCSEEMGPEEEARVIEGFKETGENVVQMGY